MLNADDIRRQIEFTNRLYVFNLMVSDRMIADLKNKGADDDKKDIKSVVALVRKQEGAVV